MSAKRLLLIDGHSLAYRAFYALPVENFATSKGQPTNAVYGLASMLINLINSEKPTHIAAAFDVSRKTFRSEKFPEYKANRSATPDEFKSQTEFIFQLIEAMGIPSFTKEGFEADDLIASLTKQAENEGFEVFICTGDRDSFQLVSSKTTVLYPKKGVTELARMTPEAILDKYGLTPIQYPDFAALRGDPSDNLPSIPGVGEKTAAKWIIEYKSLEELIKNAGEISGKVGAALREHKASVLLNHELTHLKTDLSVIKSIESLAWHGIKRSKVAELFDELEIRTLKERIQSLDKTEPEFKVKKKKVDSEITQIDGLSLSEKIKSQVIINFQIEGNRIHSYSVKLDNGEKYFVMQDLLGPWIADPKIKKIGHGLKQLGHLVEINGINFDTELAAYLINPGSRNLTLTDLAEKYLGIINQNDELFGESGDCLELIEQLLPVLQSELEKQEMSQLYNDLELPILNLLGKMERTGVFVNREELEHESSFFRGEVSKETKSAHKEAGKEFNVNSPKQLQAVLFDELKLPKTRKNKTGYTTDAESLETLYNRTKHPLINHLLRIREVSKLLSVVDGLLESIAADGRIHTEYQQSVAATGRLSSTNPNLQNIPIRTDEGRRIRRHFIPEKPYVSLLTADYSQIELRIMAHLSKDEELIKAFNSGEDLHSTMAALVFGVKPTEVDHELRSRIKAMSYGLAYGLSAYGLAAQLDISAAEANHLMERYMDRFGGVQRYLKLVVEQARKDGYTETMFGRRRYLPDLNQENRMRREIAERAALNAPMQGTAADIIKIAMLNVEKLITESGLKSRLLLQVHDELVFEVAAGEVDKLSGIVREGMGSAAKLSVPLDVNIGVGKSWAEAAH